MTLVVEAHARFADHYENMPGAFDRQRVRHLLGAGRARAAAELAPRAAENAVSEHAYSLAADLLLVAIDHEEAPAMRLSLLRRRAELLERAARYAEAAGCWHELVDSSAGEARIDATIHEAHTLLASHQVSQGASRLEHAMRLAGEPPATARALFDVVALGRYLLGPPATRGRRDGRAQGSRRTSSRPAIERAAAERDVRLGVILTFFDPLAGIRFLLRARARFDRADAAEQAAWCDYVFAHFAQHGTSSRGIIALSTRYRDAACARLEGKAIEDQEPSLIVMPLFLDGVDSIRLGRFHEARPILDRAARVRGPGVARNVRAHDGALVQDHSRVRHSGR